MKQPVKEAIAVGKNQKSPDDDDRLSRRRHLRLCRCQHVCRRQSICLGRKLMKGLQPETRQPKTA